MSDPWWVRCANCDAFTAPCHREARRCGACGCDPRSGRTRAAEAVWAGAAVVGLVLAVPALAVGVAGLWAYETIKDGER